MKENRLGPRQWAFVVVAGGAVFALPFMQREQASKSEPPVVDAASTLLPDTLTEASIGTAPVTASMTSHSHADSSTSGLAKPAGAADGIADGSIDSLVEPSPPTWPVLPHSPFDDMVQQKAIVVDAKPTEEIVPMQPLRPWISAPNLSGNGSAGSSSRSTPASTSSASPAMTSLPTSQPATQPVTSRPAVDSLSKLLSSAAQASPWREDGDDETSNTSEQIADATRNNFANGQVAQSIGQGRRKLPVSAGPADQYTVEEIAEKLNLPKADLASAIVPADQVLPPPPLNATQLANQPASSTAIPKSSVVLSRQPNQRPLGAQVRFGQADSRTAVPEYLPTTEVPSQMVPLPTLPEERRGHIITQPKR